MANSLYDAGRENFAIGNVSWTGDNIKLVLIDHGTDTPNTATDDALNDLSAGARVATSGNFASKTATAGVMDAADVTLSTVSGSTVESITIYKDSGVESSSYLLIYIDTATGLPFTPSGGDVIVQWDSGANKIAKL